MLLIHLTIIPATAELSAKDIAFHKVLQQSLEMVSLQPGHTTFISLNLQKEFPM